MSKSQHLAGAIAPSIDSLFACSHAICPQSARVKCSRGHWSLQKKELPKWFNLMTSSKKKRPHQDAELCSELFRNRPEHDLLLIFNEIWSSVWKSAKYSTFHLNQPTFGMSEVGAQEEILKVDPATPLWEIFLTKSQARKCPNALVQCLSAGSSCSTTFCHMLGKDVSWFFHWCKSQRS